MPHRNSAQQAILQGQLSNPYLAMKLLFLYLSGLQEIQIL